MMNPLTTKNTSTPRYPPMTAPGGEVEGDDDGDRERAQAAVEPGDTCR